MKTRLWVVSAMAAWLACDSGPNEQMAPGQLSLLELVQKRDNVVMSVDLETSELVLDYNPFTGGCVSLSDVSFDVNGERPLRVISLGQGTVTDEPPVDSCTRPTWLFNPRDAGEPETTFTLTQKDFTVVAKFSQLAAPRTLGLPDASVSAYETIELQWAPSSDNLFWDTFNADAPKVYLVPPDGGSSWGPIDIAKGATPGAFKVTLPGLPQGELDLGLYGAIERGVVDCTPTKVTCTARSRVGYEQQLNPTVRLSVGP